jgi:hypothetical protein
LRAAGIACGPANGLLLEVFVAVDVDSFVLQLETHVVAAVIAGGKGLPIYASHLVALMMCYIVNNGVNTRSFTLLTGLKNISYGCHVSFSLLPDRSMEESQCAGGSSMSGS